MNEEWQPMETAPKDRTPFLVYIPEPAPRHFKYSVVVFVPEFSYKDEFNEPYFACCGDFPDFQIEYFAGWMPLPQPPKDAAP